MISSEDLRKELTLMLSELPGVETLQKSGHVSFLIHRKIFAYTRPQGVVLKLPATRVTDLAKSPRAAVLVMGKRKMKEWVVLSFANAKEVTKDLPLFKEALSFVKRE